MNDAPYRSRITEFRGNGLLFVRNASQYTVLFLPLLSVCFMGALWWRPFLLAFLVLAPGIGILALLVSRVDRLVLDDDHARMRGPGGSEIAYGDVKKLDILEMRGIVGVRVRRGLFQSDSFMYALNAAMTSDLRTALIERMPHGEIRTVTRADWKALGLVLGVLLFVTAFFHGYLYRSNPFLKTAPAYKQWTHLEKPAIPERTEDVGDFTYVRTENFVIRGKEKQALLIVNPKTLVEVRIVATERVAHDSRSIVFLRNVLGLKDAYDVLDMAYHARIGIIPLMIKDSSLRGLDDVALYDVDLETITGYCKVGKKGIIETVHCIMRSKHNLGIAHLMLSGPRVSDEETIHGIVAGLHPRTSGAAAH